MNNTLSLSRTYPYTVEKVYSKYSNPEALARWWWPRGFTNSFHSFDFQPGGKWIFTMHSKDADYLNEHVFHVIETNRILTEHTVEPHFSIEILFEKIGENETKMTWISTFKSSEFLKNMYDFLVEKNNENFDRLGEELDNV
jgi:uncharacterized protein YndB with AHSA1/START domain